MTFISPIIIHPPRLQDFCKHKRATNKNRSSQLATPEGQQSSIIILHMIISCVKRRCDVADLHGAVHCTCQETPRGWNYPTTSNSRIFQIKHLQAVQSRHVLPRRQFRHFDGFGRFSDSDYSLILMDGFPSLNMIIVSPEEQTLILQHKRICYGEQTEVAP